MYVAAFCGEVFLLLSKIRTVACDHTLRVEHEDIFALGSESLIELCTRNGGGTGTVHHYSHLRDVLTVHLKGVLQSGSRDDSRTVLVVVHHRDVESALQALLDIEALRSLDVLKVDTTECRCNLLHGLAEFLRVFFSYFDIENVDTAINLEQQSLTFHHWFTAHCANISQSEHGSTITDHSHKVALVCIFVCVIRVLLDFKTRKGHAW